MAVKRSILEVDVRDAKFKEFLRLFEKYQKSLKGMSPEWAAADKASAGTLGSVRMMTAALLAQSDIMRRQVASQTSMATASRQTALNWASISHHARETANTVYQFAGRVLRWTGIGGAAVGLATGASVWGLERLATAASYGRRSSSGLGLPYGQQSAFGLSYNRLIDTGSFLGGVSAARGNVASPAATALWTLGVNPTGGGNTGSMALQALDEIRRRAQQTPEEQLGILAQTHMLGELGLSVEDLRRIKGLSNEEYQQYATDYAKRTEDLKLGDKTLKRWQDFDNALETAGEKLKTALIGGLEKLIDPLTKLSEAASDAVQAFIGSRGFQWVIEQLSRGLKAVADYVGTDAFKNDMRDLGEGVKQLAQKITWALRLLGVIPDSQQPAAPARPSPVMTYEAWVAERERGMEGQPEAVKERIRGRHRSSYQEYLRNNDRLSSPIPTSQFGDSDFARWQRGISGIESGGRYDILGPVTKTGDRAYGRYQVMGSNIPAWTKEALGREMSAVEFLANPAAQDAVFKHIFGKYVREHGESGAAARWFSGSANTTSSARDQLGTTVPGYVGAYNRFAGNGTTVKIDINNNTGGSATVSASQLVVPQ